METEFDIIDKNFSALDAHVQTQILDWLKAHDYADYNYGGITELNRQIEAAVTDKKAKGYIYSEITPVRVIHITSIGISSVSVDVSAYVRIPYTVERIPSSNYYDVSVQIKYVSPNYTKQMNSRGAIIADAARAFFQAKQDREVQEAADKRARREQEDAEREAQRAQEAEILQGIKDDERAYIESWISGHGSDRLKKAVELDLPYINLFKREWANANFGQDVKVYNNIDRFEIDAPATPSLAEMQKYEAAVQYIHTLPEFPIYCDLSAIRPRPDPDEYYPDDERPAPDLAIIFEIRAEAIDPFWIIRYI